MEGGTTATGIEAVTSALETGLTSTGNSIMTAIGDILPIALLVVGAVLVVTIGIKVFKRIAGR